MTERWRQESLEGVDLDDGLAELPLRTSPEARPRRGAEPRREAGEPAAPDRGSAAEPNLDLFGNAAGAVPEARTAGEGRNAAGAVPEARAAGEGGDAAPEEPLASSGERSAPPGERLLGGLADLAVHLGMLAAALLSMSSLELAPALGQWPGFLAFLLVFSFLYHVVSLSFWGQTPGMAWRSLRARDAGGRLLSFRQAGARWIGALVTVGLAGLPLLLALGGGGSLSDRLSGSRTTLRPD